MQLQKCEGNLGGDLLISQQRQKMGLFTAGGQQQDRVAPEKIAHAQGDAVGYLGAGVSEHFVGFGLLGKRNDVGITSEAFTGLVQPQMTVFANAQDHQIHLGQCIIGCLEPVTLRFRLRRFRIKVQELGFGYSQRVQKLPPQKNFAGGFVISG